MQALLVDDEGAVWDEGSPVLRRKLHAAGDVNLAEYAIRNLGYVGFRLIAAGSYRVRLRPKSVSPVGLSAISYLLADLDVDRVVVSYHDEVWRHQFYNSRETAIRGVAMIVADAITRSSGAFRRMPADFKAMPQNAPLSELMRVWTEAKGVYNRRRLDPILRTSLSERYVLVRESSDSGGLVLDEVGTGLPKVAAYWLSRAVGYRVEDQPDCLYGRWVAQAYRDTLNSGRPALEAIDARIKWPNSGRQRHLYTRLILPFRLRADGPDHVLLGATAVGAIR